ncbi:MAG: hypothetical protein JOY66_17390 [Acetobacteraceae bacterium]|nr:hypothetical protein [Acetobacteraceae bacterium]
MGLNYLDHAKVGEPLVPDYPTLFARCSTGLVAHGQPPDRDRNAGRRRGSPQAALLLKDGDVFEVETERIDHYVWAGSWTRSGSFAFGSAPADTGTWTAGCGISLPPMALARS